MEETYLTDLAYLEMLEIKDELEAFLITNYHKPFALEYRIKSLDKIHQKQSLYSSRNEGSTISDIPDIIGFRLSVPTEEEVEKIYSLVVNRITPNRVVDFFHSPKTSGYKAFNCFYDNWGFNTEIQIMTNTMRDWTNETHEEHNQRKYGEILTRTKQSVS